ncbi:hypothetical protein PC129_g13094 [Phytophthora cactorum]|uniref:Ankyrin repeat-containing domain n=1 Tax=Phytophthora cactorum TaxID=29920 RepID=A0A8T1HVL0_9STRA|nr:hypothetical protein PC129_g13094 [Phytophthora cactorum]KAG4049335.1 hypothetical protein PC123_g15381 [Phytophthora cactorum]
MIPASLAGKACRKASNRVQTDTFLLEHDRFERVYQCRKTRFQALQQQKDTSIESIFILSDDEPWEVFRKTNTTEGRMQRRKLVFERCRDFPVLHQACIDGDRDQVHSLLNTPGVCVLERDACGRIALHHAVIKEHFKIVKRLLRRRDAKVQTHVRDNSNRTALHYVLGKMEVLARHRKRLNIPALITTEMRVESKRYRRLWELADRMLEMFSRKELEAVGEDGESIKVLDMRCRGDVWDVCRSGDLERLEMFVKVYGCSKDEWQLSELKRTLLHEACENQQLQVVYFLIVTMDVPVLAQDTSGCTALHCAARRGYLDGCQMLLGKAANGENSQLNDSTEELVLVQDDRGRTALHWCLLGSCDPLIRLQLAVLFAQSFPAVLHICDQDGVAPLALAIWRGEIELVQEFISLGANVCASARIPQSPYGKNVEKASWAPCGIAFQRRCLRKLVKVVPRSDPTDNVPDITRSPECSKKHVINWENLQHPVEALWYWTQRSNEGNSAFNEKRIINEENKLSDSEPATTEEELGCRKYGGICRRCESFTSGYSVKTPPSPPNVSESRLCRPLLLALRMCALRLDSGSMLNDRVVIVELLLTNGASPDENCDGEYLSNHAKQVNSIDPSALSESLRSSLQYSQIIPMLRHCFDTVFPESTQDKSNALAAIKSVRVGRKTMVQWILVHDRYDIMRWLLKLLPPGIERGLCWSAFVAAATVNGKESITTPSSGDVLFSVYVEDVQTHLGVNERKDLVINLILRTAIPTDSVALLERLLNFWGASGPNCCDPSDAEHFGNYLKPVGVLHAIARWNAVRVAEFCLSGQCASEYQINQVNWQQIFSEENQHCHVLDGCTPLELCRLLGHYQLYKFLSSRLQTSLPEAQTDDVVENIIVESPENKDSDRSPQVGLLRSIIDINDALVAQGKAEERFTGYQRYAIIQDLWVSAVTHNQVSHLQGMSLSSHPDVSVRTLVLAAIKASSFNALKWLLEANAPITTQLSDEEGIECLYAAAKHSGDVYAKMTLLLLEHQLSPGRLSGDGMGVPLLHRAACFSNATLACRIMTLLLGRPECDVNALDAFGNTAVSYAIAVGCIHNACFLIQNSKCRLEAEYEGQSCFYYALHLVPSFAWRTIVRELLVTKRARAFLHCDADNKTCGCKGYEGEDGDLHRPCGFCGHESTSHRIVPLPSWFRDQYDTYIVAKLPRKRSHSSSDEGDDSDGDMSRQYLTDNYDTADGEDEEIVLENDRGRLDVQLLKRVTALRYDGILHANGLCGAVAVESPVDVQIAEETVTDNCNNCDLSSHPPEKESVLPKMEIDARDLQGNADPCVELYGDGIHRRGRKFTGPRWLQEELAMVHSPRCLCQSSACVTSPTQLVHIAVCRWLRRTALVRTHVTDRNVTESAIIALASVHPAFEHWRGVARLDKQSPIEAVAGPLTPLPRFLSGVMFHWRYGKEFWAFQRWKNYRTTTEVAHHRLETRLEHVAANMRRNRFITLQQRQQQLQNTAQSLKPTR